MNNGICYIVGAGDFVTLDFVKGENDFIIAADGGIAYLEKCGIVADLYVGDEDSGIPPLSVPKILLPTNKDCTDMLAAINEGIKRGFCNFCIYCAEGGRLDHTFANIQCLHYLNSLDKNAKIVGKNFTMLVLTSAKLKLFGEGSVSIFSLTEASEGVDLVGFKYPLDNATITNKYPLGISNQIYTEGEIRVRKGSLLVMYSVGIKA